jgi:putative hemolysin
LAKLTHTPIPSNGVISAVQKHETAAFFNDIHEESFLSTVQTDIVNRLLIVSTTTVGSAMVPLREIQLVSVDSNRQEILEIFRKRDFTRLPVYENTQDNIVGFINVYEVLCSKKKVNDLHDFVKLIRKINQDTLVTNAMEAMQREEGRIALVVRVARKNHETPIGVITMKDLVEELFGELGSW